MPATMSAGSRSTPRAAMLALGLGVAALACHDAAGPVPALEGRWVADQVEDSGGVHPLPYTTRCTRVSCIEVVDFQLRFRTRGRVLDVRRFNGWLVNEAGDAYGYRLVGAHGFQVTRPNLDQQYVDSGTVSGDTILVHVRRQETPSGLVLDGPGPVYRFIRARDPQ